jgi:hypothetical protein
METSPQNHTGSPADSFTLPECLDMSEADVIVRSSDRNNFRVHKVILASSSPVFRDMFSLPQSLDRDSGTVYGLPVVDISEDAELVRCLITILYPIPSKIPASYDRILALLAAAQKYDMVTVQSSIRGELTCRQLPVLVGAQAFHAYAIASSWRLIPELNKAASLTLDYPMMFEHLGGDLALFERSALQDLANFRKNCRDELVSCFEPYLDAINGPSTIWIGCQASKPTGRTSNRDPPTLPTWLQECFTQQIEELKQDFTRSLTKPSIIRAKYLEALRKHAVSGRCTFCLERHALQGEDYCMKLEQAITRARDKASVHLKSSPGV